MSELDPIHRCIEHWHAHMRGKFPGGLDALLHEDCVFLSPIVFTPQAGRELTKLYLSAAGNTFGGDGGPLFSGDDDSDDATTGEGSGFRYTKEVLQGHSAMLEFETTVEGKYVNGVDIITCDDNALITEFRVMIRPLQAVNLMHRQMQAMLEQMSN